MDTTEEIIEDIRESRRRISEQCGHDPAALVEYLKTFNDKYATQVERSRKDFHFINGGKKATEK